MNYSRLDLFSAPFSFTFGNQVKRKGTIYGTVLSLSVFMIFLVYSCYLFYLYLSNQINPTYGWQSFVTEETTQIDLTEELVGFRYEYGVNLNLDDLQAEKNKTYLVFLPYFFYQNGTDFQMMPLNYTKCTSPKLKGFNCFDFSTIKNYTLILNTIENLYSQLYIFIYRCQDTDQLKTFIPNNCVYDDDDYNSVVYNPYSDFLLKLKTSQYNTSSQQMQVNYRNSFIYMSSSSFQYYSYKIQKQTTTIKSGAIIQSQSTFSSPIQYEMQNINEDRQAFIKSTQEMQYMQITIQMDEIIQQIQIQYLNLPQILSQCNSTLALLICIGVLGRKIAEQFMRQDIFLLLLQNMFQGTYESILRKNNFISDYENQDQEILVKQDQIKEDQREAIGDVEEKKSVNNEDILVPSFLTKSIKSVDNQSSLLQNQEILTNYNENQSDFILEQYSKKFEESNSSTHTLRKQRTYQKQSKFVKKEQSLSSFQLKNLQFSQPIDFKDQEATSKKTSEESQNISAQSGLLKKQTQEKNENKSQISRSLNFKKMQDRIKNKMKSFMNNSILNGIRQKIFKIKIYNKQEYLKSQGLDAEDQRVIDRCINENLDILQIYRDLILLKKAVMIILSNEQLAMLQLVGLSSNFCKQRIKYDKNLLVQGQDQPAELSHFDEQISILKDNEKQEKYINSFFEKLKINHDQTEVDQRILNSLI